MFNLLVSSTKSYIKNTNPFLLSLDSIDEIPDNALLCTADAEGLYLNILHGEGFFKRCGRRWIQEEIREFKQTLELVWKASIRK